MPYPSITFRRLVLAATVVTMLTLVGASAGSAAQSRHHGRQATIVIRAASGDAATTPTSVALKDMAAQIEKQSKGRIQFKLYFYTQLGSNTEKYTLLKANSIQILTTQPGYLAADYPPLQVVNFPYQFTNRNTVYAALDGAAGAYLNQQVIKATGSVRILGWGEYGWEGTINRVRPIHYPADMKGLKIRPAPGNVAIDDLKALGANPTSIDFTEAYTALQQGVLDGATLPLPALTTAKIYEVAPYYSDTHDFLSFEVMLMNNSFFSKLSKTDQGIIQSAAVKYMRQERVWNAGSEKKYLAYLKANGTKVVTLSQQQLKDFKKAAAPVVASWEAKLGTPAKEFLALAASVNTKK